MSEVPLVDSVAEIEDSRCSRNTLYPIEEIVLLAICGVISGEGKNERRWLRAEEGGGRSASEKRARTGGTGRIVRRDCPYYRMDSFL